MKISLGTNDSFLLTIPSSRVKGEHTVEIPCSEAGMRVMQRILRARNKSEATIGKVASPVQSMIDAWLKADKVAKEEKARKAAEEARDRYGFDLEELGL